MPLTSGSQWMRKGRATGNRLQTVTSSDKSRLPFPPFPVIAHYFPVKKWPLPLSRCQRIVSLSRSVSRRAPLAGQLLSPSVLRPLRRRSQDELMLRMGNVLDCDGRLRHLVDCYFLSVIT